VTAIHSSAVAAEIERLVIGADYGADGYTTLAQADELARRLALRPGARLLELGSGSGWPGLHLAKTSGCAVVLTDLPGPGASPPARACSGRPSAPRPRACATAARPSRPAADPFHSPPLGSTRSSAPTSCVDCAPSSPC
jgi:hypothetical protein